jgi:flavodoxin
MKALVTYYSETGNTKKLAQAIYDGLGNDIDKEIKPVQEVQNTEGYAIIFYGFPVHAHSVPVKAMNFIARLPKGQKIAFFSTYGSLRGGILPKQAFEHAVSLAMKAKVLGHFGCRGQVKAELLDTLVKNLEHKAWANEAQSASGHPDENDLAEGKSFAAEVIAKIR